MLSSRRVFVLLAALLASVFLVVVGHIDLDWMVVAPRFNGWYYSVGYWEFAPYFRLGWHVAYVFTVVRVAVGWLGLGATLTYLGLKLKER